MEQVNAIRNKIGTKPPFITITDHNKVIKAAITKQYPHTKP